MWLLVTNLVTEFINTGWNNTAFPEQKWLLQEKKNISPATILIFLYKSFQIYTTNNFFENDQTEKNYGKLKLLNMLVYVCWGKFGGLKC